jgi:hypothetical protein
LSLELHRGGAGSVAVLSAVLVGLVLSNPTWFMFDDAYFYLQIAGHLAEGHGSTFHGFGWTNGYHPLWLSICVPLLALARWTGVSAIHLVVAVQVVLALGIAAMVVRLCRQAAFPYPTLPLAVVATFFLGGGVWGSEGFLNGFLQLLALSLLLQAHTHRRGAMAWIMAGAILGLAVLARLDLVFLAGVCCLSALFQRDVRWRDRLRDAGLMGLAVTMVMLPYLFGNLDATGHLMPISGAIKSTFPVPHLAGIAGKLGSVGRNVCIGSVVALAFAASPAAAGPRRLVLMVLGSGTLCQAAYVVVFTGERWSTNYDYYYVTGALVVAFAASVIFATFGRLLPSLDTARRSTLAAVLSTLMVATALLPAVGRAVSFGPAGVQWAPEPLTVRLGRWLGSNLPPGSRLFTVDAPGRLAWFSGLPVFAADGLTHDFHFAEELQQPDLAAWLERKGVTHVVGQLYDYRTPWVDNAHGQGETVMRVLAPHTGIPVGELHLVAEEALVTTAVFDPDSGQALVGVWRWPHP